MHPALSVIFFTVVSGAGYGLIALTAALDLLGGVPGFTVVDTIATLFIGLVLTTLGLLSSTLHLANPKNAWRAFFRFRTSWLSREGVFAVLFYPLVLAYMAGLWFIGGATQSVWTAVSALLTVVLALVIIFVTSMIYASLRTIPQWNSPLVPANYLLLGLASGGVVLSCIAGFVDAPVETVGQLTLLLVFLAGVSKLVYYFWIGKPSGSTINTALGMTRGQIKMLEAGQSSETFLDREFAYRAPARKLRRLRLVVYVLGFIVPFALLVGLLRTDVVWFAPFAVATILAGLFAERWLFFAEARHTVNLFYGRQQV